MKLMTGAFLFVFFVPQLRAQTLGGNALFNFVKQPNCPQLSALGGVNVSNISIDIGLSFHNPSLLRREMSGKVNASFISMPASVKSYSLLSAFHAEKLGTTFSAGVNYFNYGTVPQTDPSGSILGNFRPNDYVVQFGAGRRYKENWNYGVTLKYIASQYGVYKSNGFAVDVGVTFWDSVKQFQASVVVKNMGTQLKAYDGDTRGELPFDLQAGITKRLAKAPLQFSLTAHNLHRYNIRYNDTIFLASEGVEISNKKFTVDKLISHLVLAAQVFVNSRVELTAGYNFLRRKDLNVLNASNGLNGFSMGGGLLLKNLDVRYAAGFYQQNLVNQIGINFSWK